MASCNRRARELRLPLRLIPRTVASVVAWKGRTAYPQKGEREKRKRREEARRVVLTTGHGYGQWVRQRGLERVPGDVAPDTRMHGLEGPGRAFAEQSGEDDRSAQEQRKENSLPHGTASFGWCSTAPGARW